MFKRQIQQHLITFSEQYPVLTILGPRQSGKTTLCKQLFGKTHKYVNLEDLDTRDYALNDPRAFLADIGEKGLIIDEIQHAPDLFSYIQTTVDKEQQCGRFILIGSQNFLIQEKICQSLAGRVALFTLLPFSLQELQENNVSALDLEEQLFQGLYPRVVASDVEASTWNKNYLKTYVERDVRMIKNIADLGTFQTFLKMCAARCGQLLDLTSLGQDCGISHATARSWINILEASFIVFLLRPHHKNFNKRLVKSPKLYFYDTGLLCYLLNIENAQQLTTHFLRGGIFEAFVISEMIKGRVNANHDPNLFF